MTKTPELESLSGEWDDDWLKTICEESEFAGNYFNAEASNSKVDLAVAELPLFTPCEITLAELLGVESTDMYQSSVADLVYTDGLHSCTALMFTLGGRCFLHHVVSDSNPSEIMGDILSHFQMNQIDQAKQDSKFKLFVVPGFEFSIFSLRVCYEVASQLGLCNNMAIWRGAFIMDRVGIQPSGPFLLPAAVEEARKILIENVWAQTRLNELQELAILQVLSERLEIEMEALQILPQNPKARAIWLRFRTGEEVDKPELEIVSEALKQQVANLR